MIKKVTHKGLMPILEEAYNESSVKKTVSVLLIADTDVGTEKVIKKWEEKNQLSVFKQEKTFLLNPGGFIYDFLRGKEFDAMYFDIYSSEKDNRDTILNLIDKNGARLIVVQMLFPLYTNGEPLFTEDDYSKFDYVYQIEMNDDFSSEMDRSIERAKSMGNESLIKEFEEEKNVGLFILSHPDFHFTSIYSTGKPDRIFGGEEHSYFTPGEFKKVVGFYDKKSISLPETVNISDEPRQMIKKILEEYKRVKGKN